VVLVEGIGGAARNREFLEHASQRAVRQGEGPDVVGIHGREPVCVCPFEPKCRNARLQRDFAAVRLDQDLHVSDGYDPSPLTVRRDHKQGCDADAVAPG
jgi:hypothetical protein